MWFEDLTGFREHDVDDVAGQFDADGEHITSRVNDRRMRRGRFETPTLGELRQRVTRLKEPGRLRLREVVADVRGLHIDPASAGTLFQVASQFNTLEMVNPSVTPEDGIDRYEHDRTQGPACAIACGAGTIHRNYLVPLDGGQGQTGARQVHCFADLARELGVDMAMQNGYLLPTPGQLDLAHDHIDALDDSARDALMSRLRIGLQWNTEVTLSDGGHTVSQAYCSAVPVAYSDLPAARWEPLARLVLDAAYEATLHAAVVNAASTGRHEVWLTKLGGGAFGNPTSWIVDAIRRAADCLADVDLDVAVVSYGRADPDLSDLLGAN